MRGIDAACRFVCRRIIQYTTLLPPRPPPFSRHLFERVAPIYVSLIRRGSFRR